MKGRAGNFVPTEAFFEGENDEALLIPIEGLRKLGIDIERDVDGSRTMSSHGLTDAKSLSTPGSINLTMSRESGGGHCKTVPFEAWNPPLDIMEQLFRETKHGAPKPNAMSELIVLRTFHDYWRQPPEIIGESSCNNGYYTSGSSAHPQSGRQMQAPISPYISPGESTATSGSENLYRYGEVLKPRKQGENQKPPSPGGQKSRKAVEARRPDRSQRLSHEVTQGPPKKRGLVKCLWDAITALVKCLSDAITALFCSCC
jgi:hypothetical protein